MSAPATVAAAPALRLRGVARRCGAVQAVGGVDLDVAAGEIHAVVGENGAGKSTLMKIAYGLMRADTGTIAIGDEAPVPAARHSVGRARARGVGMVHQHGLLVPTLTVAENAVLGREPTRRGLIDDAATVAALTALGARYGLDVAPRAVVETLSVGEQQRAEILAVLHQGAQVLILDEPTAVLTPLEVEPLLAVLRRLAAGGAAIVLITHKLDEIVAIADRVTVLRRGKVVARLEREALSADAIARAMVGGEPPPPVEPLAPPGVDAPVALAVRGLVVAGARKAGPHEPEGRGAPGLGDGVAIDLEVRAGEIVGVAGVEGNGQRELAEAIAGLVRPRRGQVALAGRDVTAATVAVRQRAGLGHVPEDRQGRGLVLDASVVDNLILGRDAEVRGGLGRLTIDRGAARALAARLVARFAVEPGELTMTAGELSGGNQQKLVVGRELTRPGLRAVVAAQPTRGVDIGAVARIHNELRAAAAAGVAVLLVSADLDELLALAHRIVVLHRGALVGALAGAELRDPDARHRLGALMIGAVAAPGAEAAS